MRSLPPTPFAGDLGDADATLAERLIEYAAGEVADAAVISVLCSTRVFVAIVARAAEVELNASGLAEEKRTDMEVVLWKRPTDGRIALLAFTSMHALRRWSPEARPSPVTVADAARVARAESASALLIDVAGPVRFVVETTDLEHLAAGDILVSAGVGHAWVSSARDGSSA